MHRINYWHRNHNKRTRLRCKLCIIRISSYLISRTYLPAVCYLRQDSHSPREKWCVFSKLCDCCDWYQKFDCWNEQKLRKGKVQNWKCSHIQCMCRTKWWRKGVGVREELTNNNIMVVVASEMGHAIISIVVRNVKGFYLCNWVGTLYKLAVLTHKVQITVTSSYLSELVQTHAPSWALRFSDARTLVVPRIHTELARRAFSIAAPSTWNFLPADIWLCKNVLTFKHHLKTDIFKLI